MADVSKLVMRFEQEGLSGVQADMNSADSSLKNIASSAGQVGGALTAGVTLPLIGMGVVAFNAASTTSEAVNKVNVVFGEGAGIVTTWASTAATQLGLSNAAALIAAGTFGNLFTNMGFSQTAAAGMSTQMVTLASDMASFNNVPVDQALEAIRSGLIGESEPLRQFGVMLDEASVKAEAMRMGLYNGEGALTANARAQATLSLIMQQTTLAQGDFARTSDGAANQMKIAQAQVSDLAATFGAQLLPIGISVLGALNNLLGSFQNLSPTMQTVVTVVAGVAAAAGPLLMAFSAIVTVAPAVGAAFTIMTGPIGLVVAALAGLFIAYQTNFLGFRDGVNAAVSGIVSEFNTLKSAFDAGGIGGVFSKLGEQISSINWGGLGQAIGEGLRTAAITGATAFGEALQQHGLDALELFALTIPITMVELFVDANIWLLETGGQIIIGLADGLTNGAASELVTSLGNVISGILTPFASSGEWLVEIGSGIIGGMASGLTSGWTSEVVPQLLGIPGGIVSTIGDTTYLLWSAGYNLIWGMKDGVVSAASGFIDSVVSVIGDAISAAKDKAKIWSPSQVFMEMGEFMGAGLALGIDASRSRVADSGTNLAAAAIPSTSSLSSRLIPTGSSGLNSLLGSGGGVVNHITYYVIEPGSYVGPSALAEIERHVASGQARRVDRSISRSRLAESY